MSTARIRNPCIVSNLGLLRKEYTRIPLNELIQLSLTVAIGRFTMNSINIDAVKGAKISPFSEIRASPFRKPESSYRLVSHDKGPSCDALETFHSF
jgi:hypothetical protein